MSDPYDKGYKLEPAPYLGLMDKIAAVADVLEKEAAVCDELGHVSPASEEALRSTGVVKYLHPKDFGGLEGNPVEFVEGCMEIAALNSSAGWIAGVVGVHPHEVALGTRELQAEIWGESGEDADTWIASPYQPGGVAVPTEGGYIFNGHWSYSSGTDLCQWVTIGGFIADADGEVRDRSVSHFAIPRSDYEILETSWNVLGLKGAGSKDLVIKDKFVPEHRVIHTDKITEGTAFKEVGRGDVAMFGLPRNVIFAGAVAAATIGIADGVARAVIEYNKTRESRHGKASQDPHQLRALGQATADIEASKVHLVSDMQKAYDTLLRDEPITLDMRMDIRRNQVRATNRAAEAANEIFKIAGAVAIREEYPLERRWRDSQAALHHIHNLQPAVYQTWGLHEFGFEGLPSVKV